VHLEIDFYLGKIVLSFQVRNFEVQVVTLANQINARLYCGCCP
jgi:hypothetical protein